MNTKILITFVIIFALVGGGVYFLLTTTSIPQPPPFQAPERPTPSPTPPTPAATPSVEEFTKLWANGVRCPKKSFAIPSKPEDFVSAGSAEFVVNVVEVNFTDGATCEDAERIAVLLNGRIIGFEPLTNGYEIEIPTRTVPELEAAIQKVEALNYPKIEGVFKAVVPAPKSKGL